MVLRFALGYISDEVNLEGRFSDSPWIKGSQIYKTGDLARYRNDGSIEFLGRADDQVKIRGFRVELGEIEKRLNDHPDIREAVVSIFEDQNSIQRLVAYLATDLVEADIPAIKGHLKSTLPDYMVPSGYVFLDELPLSSNKKVDRKALPKPDIDRTQAGEAFLAPETHLEERIANVWSLVP